MVVLTIVLDFAPENATGIAANFRSRFLPAIATQKGFVDAALGQRPDAPGQGLILLFFKTEEQRLAWVASPEHDPAWNSIASLCKGFTPVSYQILASARNGL